MRSSSTTFEIGSCYPRLISLIFFACIVLSLGRAYFGGGCYQDCIDAVMSLQEPKRPDVPGVFLIMFFS